MKVLIIGTHRSGTSNLMIALSEVFNLKHIPEPWNLKLNESLERNSENFTYPDILNRYGIVKSLVDHYPPSFDSCFDFYKDCKKHFDHILLLGRENRIQLAESKAYASTYNKWYSTYSIEKDNILELDMDSVNRECDNLIKLASVLNIPITWYEDLYSGDMDIINHVVNKWSLDIETNVISRYLNPKDKLRKFLGGKKTLI